MKLLAIPADSYSDYRYRVIFDAYKWDPQVGDSNTVAKHALLIDADTANMLGEWTERLAEETMRLEEALMDKPRLAKKLGLPTVILKALDRLRKQRVKRTRYDINPYKREKHVRLMRFDFHPVDTEIGWAISEVNSDVPGGMAEASVFPQIAAEYFDGYYPYINTAECLYRSFEPKAAPGGTMAFVHCTSYSDDRQVMRFLSDYFEERGFSTILMAPDHIKWDECGRAVSILKGHEGQEIDGIIRFFPLEWLVNLPRRANWRGFYGSRTPSCNHPVAALTQSKRLPLIWDEVGVDLSTWKLLLPETREPKSIKVSDDGWIYKPALGRVGEDISIKGTAPDNEIKKIVKEARRYPKGWVAQRMFNSRPLEAEDGARYHLCVGSFAVDGRRAGFYGRVNTYPRMDANAKDIPILVEANYVQQPSIAEDKGI